MLRHLIASAEQVFQRIVVVVGPGMEALQAVAAPHPCVVQHDRLGTGHAALQAAAYFGDGDVAVLYADNPLVRPQTMRRLLERRAQGDAGLVLLAMEVHTPNRYGRLVQRDGYVERIVEFADASPAERQITLCNAGALCASADALRGWLQAVGNTNAAGEYYLTDVAALAYQGGVKVAAVQAPEDELRGVNSRVELAQAEAVLQSWLRRAAMEGGATLTAPETVFFSADTFLGPDTLVGPHVVFGPGVHVEGDVEIRAFSHLEGCHVARGASIGPYARLRPGAVVEEKAHVGNFVELKATRLGAGAKANHFAYLGDAQVGAGSNIGAGTITANYDGVFKHPTVIGQNVFIGSNSTLVAPLEIGDDALVTAGSTITQAVEPGAMAFGRARQSNKPERAVALRQVLRQRKKEMHQSANADANRDADRKDQG